MSGQLLTDTANLGLLLSSGSSVTVATSALLSTYSGASLTALLNAQAISTTNINSGSPASATSSSGLSSAGAIGLGIGLGLGIPLIGAAIAAGIWHHKKKRKIASDIEIVAAKGK